MSHTPMSDKDVSVAADIVAAYVSNNSVPITQLSTLIADVHQALLGLRSDRDLPLTAPVPAVPPKKSVHPDYLVCLEDGRKFKSLKRHLRSRYHMTPEDYRRKWNLPPDYPMVAPNYAARRSELAKGMGLGSVISR
ncbi:MAG: MucR family transcriptional regulator [Mesorhizobium sp.]